MRQAGLATRMMRCGNVWSRLSSQEIPNQQDVYERGGVHGLVPSGPMFKDTYTPIDLGFRELERKGSSLFFRVIFICFVPKMGTL